MKEDKNKGKSLRSQFREWLKEICPWEKVEDYCQFMADSAAPEVIKVRIFSHVYRYTIIAKETVGNKTYLGCQVMRRKSLAGETYYKGADLPDGNFNRATWEKIKDAILGFELVKITARAKKQKWNTMRSHYEQDGKQYYAVWLQCGEKIRDHKTYELLGTREEGVVKKPAMRDPVKKMI